ncbi:MAG TPA: VOC family protein [Thermoplasmata archaeon]|nr:VOC family protein [Thermoplasmata archaeon]HUJ78482.1 VOC family protein [Thermoplasmata archaeon]
MPGALSSAQLATLMPIRNMDRAVKFYTKMLGARVLMRGTGAMKNSWASVRVAGAEVWLITPSKREKRTLAYSTFLVRNIRSVVKKLQANGVKFSRAERSSKETRVEGPIAFEPWGAAAFFSDSEGNELMLWQESTRA